MLRGTNAHRASALGAGIALAVGLGIAAPGSAQDGSSLRIGIVTFLSGAAAGPFGVPARNAAELMIECAERGQPAGALRQQRLGGRPSSRHHRRGGRHDEASDRVPQPRPAPERRRGDRLHLERRLSRDRAGRRGAEEAHDLLRLRHAAHLRGRDRHKYLFRTGAHAAMDNVAAALYVPERACRT